MEMFYLKGGEVLWQNFLDENLEHLKSEGPLNYDATAN